MKKATLKLIRVWLDIILRFIAVAGSLWWKAFDATKLIKFCVPDGGFDHKKFNDQFVH